MSPRDDDNDPDRHDAYDDSQEQPYRSASPPVPTLKNKGKKQKSNVRRSPVDDPNQQEQPLPVSFDNNDESLLPPIDDDEDQGRSSYRKPPTPKQTGLLTYFNHAFRY